MYEFEKKAQFRESSILIYDYHGYSSKRGKNDISLSNLNDEEKNRKNGYMSKATARKVRRIGENWLYSLTATQKKAKCGKYVRKPVFITTTLPSTQIHTDKTIRSKCLNDFIKELKRKFKVRNYLQVSEMQKNGNVHFHIIVDAFCPYQETQRLWNLMIERLGYVSSYQEKFNNITKRQYVKYMKDQYSISQKKAIKAYHRQKATNFSNPQTCRVEAPKKVKTITGYLTKYISKNVDSSPSAYTKQSAALTPEIKKKAVINCSEVFFHAHEERKLDGRLWSCSKEIQDLRYFTDTYSEVFLTDHGDFEVHQPCIRELVSEIFKEGLVENLYQSEHFTFIALKKPIREILAEKQHPLIIDFEQHHQKNLSLAYA